MENTKNSYSYEIDPRLTSILDNYEKDKKTIRDEIVTNRKGLDASITYLMRENKNRMLDIDNVKGNLQASYDHLIDKIEKSCRDLLIITAVMSIAILTLYLLLIISVSRMSKDNENESTEFVMTTESPNTSEYEFGIVQIKSESQPEIIYDKNTNVMYLVSDNGNHTVILNSDGTPKLYNEE